MLCFNKNIVKALFFSLTAVFVMILFTLPVLASNLSDATALRERCEKEIQHLEVCVKNFGDKADIDEFVKGERLVKLGKVKFIQTKFPEAIEIYNSYLTIQFNLYGILAKKYIARTEKINDAVGEDMVDFIDNKKIVDYLRLAAQNVKDAKAAMASKHYSKIIDVCRTAKNYSLSTYKVVEKPLPEQYKKDTVDIDGKIYKL